MYLFEIKVLFYFARYLSGKGSKNRENTWRPVNTGQFGNKAIEMKPKVCRLGGPSIGLIHVI